MDPNSSNAANPVNFLLVWVPVTRDKVAKVQEPLPNHLMACLSILRSLFAQVWPILLWGGFNIIRYYSMYLKPKLYTCQFSILQARITQLVAYQLATGEVPGLNPVKGKNFSAKISNWIVRTWIWIYNSNISRSHLNTVFSSFICCKKTFHILTQ